MRPPKIDLKSQPSDVDSSGNSSRHKRDETAVVDLIPSRPELLRLNGRVGVWNRRQRSSAAAAMWQSKEQLLGPSQLLSDSVARCGRVSTHRCAPHAPFAADRLFTQVQRQFAPKEANYCSWAPLAKMAIADKLTATLSQFLRV